MLMIFYFTNDFVIEQKLDRCMETLQLVKKAGSCDVTQERRKYLID